MTYSPDTNLIDKAAVAGLSGVNNSLAYKVHEIEKHFHGSQQIFGLTTLNLARKSKDPIIVTGGQQAWGTEFQIHDGTVIESGSATMKFDFNTIYLTDAGAANRPTYIEVYYGSVAGAVNCTFTNATDKVDKAGHGLSNGTKIQFSNSGGGLPTGLTGFTTYYVVNKGTDDFEVSLTLGGSKETFSSDGTGTSSYHLLTQTLLTEFLLAASSTTTDATPYVVPTPRITCNNRLWVRGYTCTANTCAYSFYIGLHTYIA